jgi:C-terminal processing protease CtpA/Prc
MLRKSILALAVSSFLGVGVGSAMAVEQPHTQAALHYLELAKQEILVADLDRNHGGHAGEATRLIDEAIQEVRKALQYRDEHPN